MHEAGAVGGALEKVIHAWPESKKEGHLELEIRDATRAEAGSVEFYAAAILADHGYGDVTFDVITHPVHCALCGAVAPSASPTDPQCNECGAPLPQVEGPSVVCREIEPKETTPCA
jgi:hypothetical protein